ncbi:MAG: hypothetical protein M3391_04765 [Actinomycetota bacterium]|nr:hypothetical protein [Actinomycetota bacterium]
MLQRTAAVLLSLVVTAACGSGEPMSEGTGRTITGVIVEIDVRTIEDVASFTLLNRGREYLIRVDEETEFAFPPGHLNEHRTTADPVEVVTEKLDGELYARSVEDAER